LRRFTEVLVVARDDCPDLAGFSESEFAERIFTRLAPIQHPTAQPARKTANKIKTVCKTKLSMVPVGSIFAARFQFLFCSRCPANNQSDSEDENHIRYKMYN
jgi:hypothetical protein